MDSALLASLFSITGQNILLDFLVILFAGYWEYVVVSFFLIHLLVPKETGQEKVRVAKLVGWSLVSAAVARLGVVNIVRIFVSRERPFVLEQFTPLVEHSASNAFPSGHAAFFMALAVYVLLSAKISIEKKFGWFLFASAILISVARVSAGLHWPSDIVAGWFVGALSAWMVWYLANRRDKVSLDK